LSHFFKTANPYTSPNLNPNPNPNSDPNANTNANLNPKLYTTIFKRTLLSSAYNLVDSHTVRRAVHWFSGLWFRSVNWCPAEKTETTAALSSVFMTWKKTLRYVYVRLNAGRLACVESWWLFECLSLCAVVGSWLAR